VHPVSLDALVHNTEVYKQSPIRSPWDLTKPVWKSSRKE
jgi:hypothetical protein